MAAETPRSRSEPSDDLAPAELLEAAGFQRAPRSARDERRGRRTYRLRSGVLEAYADVVIAPSVRRITWLELSIVQSRSRLLTRALTYRMNPDDWRRGDREHVEFNADTIAAVRGLAAGEVKARWSGTGLEMIVPRAGGWELVSEVRPGTIDPMSREELGDLTGFVDVRTLGDELPGGMPPPTPPGRWRRWFHNG